VRSKVMADDFEAKRLDDYCVTSKVMDDDFVRI